MKLDEILGQLSRRVSNLERPAISGFPAKDWDEVDDSQSRMSATYGDLATVGPTVTLNVSDSGLVLIALTARLAVTAGAALVGVLFSNGTDTFAADDAVSLEFSGTGALRASCVEVVSLGFGGLVTATTKYRGDGTHAATFSDRRLMVVPL